MHMTTTTIMDQIQGKKLIILHLYIYKYISTSINLCLGLHTLQIAKEAHLCVWEKLNVFALYIWIHHFEPKVYPLKTKKRDSQTNTTLAVIPFVTSPNNLSSYHPSFHPFIHSFILHSPYSNYIHTYIHTYTHTYIHTSWSSSSS